MATKFFGLVAALAVFGATVACQVGSAEDEAGAEDALTGSVRDARFERIKAVYKAADVTDFKRIAAPSGWGATLSAIVRPVDSQWYSLDVDGETVILHDFLGDPEYLFNGAAADDYRARESVVFIYEVADLLGAADAGDASFLQLALVYRAERDTWETIRQPWRKPISLGGGGLDGGSIGPASDGGAGHDGGDAG